jgi:hypothetical protein
MSRDSFIFLVRRKELITQVPYVLGTTTSTRKYFLLKEAKKARPKVNK